jgi:hypothetical protein
MRNDAVLPQPAHLVLLVILEIALEPFDVTVAFEGENVRGDAVEEPAVMAVAPNLNLNFDQLKPLLNPLDASIQPIHAVRQTGILIFQNAEPRFDLAHILTQPIHRTADVA